MYLMQTWLMVSRLKTQSSAPPNAVRLDIWLAEPTL